MDQKVIFESESTPVLRELLQKSKPEKVLLITGKKSFEESGAKNFIEQCLYDYQKPIVRFSNFENNPNIHDLRDALVLAKDLNPELIIAIGGGSVMDMGKLIRFFHTHEGEILNGKYQPCNHHIPLIAIPTTAGTGSEATHFAVLYDEAKTKHSIANQDILPDYAIINSNITHGQSPYLTACAGFDALAQGIEAYWNKNATEESDLYAEKAIKLIYGTLPRVVSAPNDELRAIMSQGAYWAGRAINITKTTAPHAFSYPFTAHYGIPHGHAVALTFPYIADFNFSKGDIPEWKINELCNMLNTDKSIYSTLKNYTLSIGLAVPINQYDFDMIIEGINLDRLANNPAKINKEDAWAILNKALRE